MDFIDKIHTSGSITGFLTEDSQERVVRVLTKIFKEKGTKRGIEECAVTMRSLADQVYRARKELKEKNNE